jgi:hypothetical protein
MGEDGVGERHLDDEGLEEGNLDRPPRVEGQAISGVVTDFDGVPLVGVRVEVAASGGGDLDLLPVLTDGEGRYTVEGLAAGRYDMRYVLGRVKARTLAVPTGTDQLRVKLARPQGILLVTRTPPDAEPPDVVYFTLMRHGPKGPVREHVGRTLKRSMLLWSIRPGRYTVTAWGGPYLPIAVKDVDVREGEPAPEVEVVFSVTGAAIEGSVVDDTGKGIPALIGWRRLDGACHVPHHLRSFPSGPAGQFSVRGLPGGRYRFNAFVEGQSIVATEQTVADEQTASVTLTLG